MKDVHSRATKNCPWLGELWVRYLLCLERGRSSESEICSVCFCSYYRISLSSFNLVADLNEVLLICLDPFVLAFVKHKHTYRLAPILKLYKVE